MIVLLLPLAFAPALFWMWWYYRQDVYEKEPKRLLALVFLLAMPFSVLTGLFEYTLDGGKGQLSENPNFVVSALFYLLVVAVVEELAKFIVVATVAYPNREFNEQMDGIIYTVAAALGFASFENVFYLLDQGPLIILLRGPVSTLGHVLFSAMWGAALGLARFEPQRRRRIRMVGRGLVWAILTHGVFDILIALGRFEVWLSVSAVLFVVLLYWLVSRQIAYALNLSQFKPHQPARLLRHLQDTAAHPPVYVPNPNSYRFNRAGTDTSPINLPSAEPPADPNSNE